MVTTRAGSSSACPNGTTQPAAASKKAVPKAKSPSHGGFRVPYEVRPSAIAGRGVFAIEPIERGTLVWEYEVGRSVLEYRSEAKLRERLENLTDEEARFLLEHIYVWKDAAVEIIDDAKIWNHTPSPNTGFHPDDPSIGEGLGSYALRDIAAGEELTDDYGDHHDLPWFEGLCKEYGCTSCTDIGKKIR
jgi:SET domain-containing protein